MKKLILSTVFFFFLLVGFVHAEKNNYLIQPPADQLLYFSYDTDLNSGAATYSYKFKLPPARALIPDLQLTYSSFSSSSEFGLGWRLTLPSVSHSETNQDVFVLNWKNAVFELVDVDESIFRPAVDEDDLKIQKTGSGWVVFTTGGERYYFENSISNKSYTLEWKLSRIEDVLGNYVEYHYDSLGDRGALYLTNIFYNGQRAVSLEPNLKVEFSYEKKDLLTQSYKEGLLSESSYRCSDIQTFYKEGNTWAPFSQYQLKYGISSQTRESRLSSIQYGARGDIAPQVSFQYREEPQFVWQSIPVNVKNSSRLLDINVDGVLDRIEYEAGKGLITYLNQSVESEAWTIKGESFESGILADFDGDGFLDFGISETKIHIKKSGLSEKSNRNLYFRGTQEGFVREEKIFPTNLTYLIEQDGEVPQRFNAGVSVVDLNGDRKPDLLVSRKGSLGEADLYTSYIMEKGQWAKHDEWVLADLSIRQLDFNGDGLTDFVSKTDESNFSLFINNGKGWNKENFPYPEYLKKDHFLFADLNQDGISDLIVEQGGAFQFFLLLNGKYEEVAIAEVHGSFEELQLADYNLDGFVDIIISGGVYLNPYKKELLTKINNGLAGITNISYALSNTFHDNRFPFVLEVVSEVQNSSGFGEIDSVSYEYEWGRINLKNKEFLGFHRVTEKRNETPLAPARVIQRYFSHDPILHGKLISEEVPNMYQDVYEWSYRWNEQEDDVIKKPQLKSKILYVYEGITPPLKTETRYAYEWVFDKKIKLFLKSVQERFLGQHVEHKFRTDFLQDEKITTHVFAVNVGEWLQKLASKTVSDMAANREERVSRRENYWYDGLPLGNIRKGLLAMEESSRHVLQRFSYNEAGLKISEQNPLGHSTQYEYDPTLTFVQKETSPLGFSILRNRDKGCGNVVSETDAANNTTTTFSYDGLCRVRAVSEPQLSLNYVFSSPHEVHVTSPYGDEVTYFKDSLGRVLARFTKQGEGYVVTDHVVYDSRGNVAKKYYPYTKRERVFEESVEKPFAGYKYDTLGRLKQKTTPSKSITEYTYGQFSRGVRDALGHEKKYSYNALGHLTATQELQGKNKILTRYEHNVLGDLLRIQSVTTGERLYTYDDRGLKKTARDQKTGFSFSSTYDSFGHKTSEFSQGKSIDYQYDAVGRIVAKLVDNRRVALYNYDAPHEEYLPDAKNLKGRLSWVKDDGGVTAFSYDRYEI